jgi:SulP family sulfate permease
MGVMVGIFQVAMGVARLGMLVNFVSHSVVVGFSSGAGVLIAIQQFRHLLGLEFESHSILETLQNIAFSIPNTHKPTLIIGFSTILLLVLINRINKNLPGSLIGMIFAATVVGIIGLDQQGVKVIGQLPRSLPPIANIPLNFQVIRQLSTGALAIGSIGLVEAISISRSIASQTNQRLDSNQEFIGQGLANLVSGIFSGYPGSGSFTRSAINFNAGAKTPLASVFSGIFVLIAVLALGPLAAYVPRTALAGVLILTAYGMINKKEIIRIWKGSHDDAVIMMVTFLGTLFLHLEFAVLLGILISFAVYILKTSVPKVTPLLPDKNFRHLNHQPGEPLCPQLGILDILGDLYFGAVTHVERAIQQHVLYYPDQRYLLLRMRSVIQCDFSGIHALENIVNAFRERNGEVFLERVQPPVFELMKSTGFYDYLGADHFLDEDEAISYLFYKIIDPSICIYECEIRAFSECQNLPKRIYPIDIHPVADLITGDVQTIRPKTLWDELHTEKPPMIIDVREPREFQKGHVPTAKLIPLPKLINDTPDLPKDRQVILVCRSGRRSNQVAKALKCNGVDNVVVLQGGILAWETECLLEAVDLE